MRFRPVLLGDTAAPAIVGYLREITDGRALFSDLDLSWPIEVTLEAASVDDLPAVYRHGGYPITILPVQEITAESEWDADRRMMATLERLYHTGAQEAQQERGAPARRRIARARR